MGGTLALLGASRYPAPAATIAYYGFPNRERTPTAPIVPIDENEVAGLESPLLAFWGTADAGVGMDNVDAYDAKLNRYGKEHEFVRYEGLPHGFLTFDESSPNFEGSADSWKRTLAFMEARLSGTGSGE
jgi:carboxymethylenebutenolidase